jgi:hypothetical protein
MAWITHENNIWKFAKPSFNAFSRLFRGISSGPNKITDENQIFDILANYFENHFKEPEYDRNNKDHLQVVEIFRQIEYVPNIQLEPITMNEVLKE